MQSGQSSGTKGRLAGAEVVADHVDVAGVNHRRAVDKLRRSPAGGRIDAFARARDARLLLGLADAGNAFAARPAAQTGSDEETPKGTFDHCSEELLTCFVGRTVSNGDRRDSGGTQGTRKILWP